MPTALVSRYRDMIRITGDAGAPLPPAMVRELTDAMQYTYVQALYGYEKVKAGVSVITERRRLFELDLAGAICCGAGYTERIVRYCAERSWNIAQELSGKWAQPPRPRCFEEDWERVYTHFQFRPRQEECVRAIAARYQNLMGGVIAAAAGFGKTELFKVLAMLYPRAKIAIVVRGRGLARDIYLALHEVTPSVGLVHGSKKEYDRVTVYSADSLHHFDHDTDLLLADEVHEQVTDRYVGLYAEHCYDAIRFGLSASVGDRFDHQDRRLEPLFGATIFELSQAEAAELGVVLPIVANWSLVDLPENPIGHLQHDTAKKRWGIWRNQGRNEILAARALAYDPNEQVLVLTETMEHLFYLKQLLPEFELAYAGFTPEDHAYFDGLGVLPPGFQPLSDPERAFQRQEFKAGRLRRVIATKVWKTGISPDYLQVVVWAPGGSSAISATQGPARAARILSGGGKSCGIVEDLIDQFDPALERQSKTRMRHYARNGWTNQLPPGYETRTASRSTPWMSPSTP